MNKPYIDIAFIIPLREEFDRLTATFPIKRDFVDGLNFWAELDLGVEDCSAVALLQDAMGKAAAVRATNAVLAKYEVGFFAVVGIAGGLSSDVAIGDVCFTGPLLDILENSKVSDSSKGKLKIEFNSIPFKTDALLTFALKYVSLGSDTKGAFEEWQLTQHYDGARLVPGEFIGRKDKNEKLGLPQIHEGSIVCGAVSKSEVYKSNISGLDRKLLAIETETGGVFSAADPHKVPVVTIRGICDYADKNKNKLEEQTNGHCRAIAASNAVSFVKLQLFNPQLRKFLEHRRQELSGVAELALRRQALDELVPSALSSLRIDVHSQLSQLSPEYNGKPAGYRLPLPRVKPSSANASISPAARDYSPQSILEAVTKHRTLLITIPKTFPDNSLPWIVAYELSLIEINGKQAVPVMISGEALKPPNGSLAKQCDLDLEALNARHDARPIFIIQGFPVEARNRVDFLHGQMEVYKEASFVIMNKEEGTTADSTALVFATSAERFDVCDISFVELSSFFKRTFQLGDQEAGVIALRLQEMFRKFELNAHPSYFAGLSVEILSSLLKANRRAELLQLAVGGFLSFVVAGDEDSVVLSRTTRESFLRNLVFRMEVQKERFDRSALIKLVEDFALEKDFEIDSILFIKAFQDKGIIHFTDGSVQISLPFMASYLLAAELASRPSDAKTYFDVQNDDFDYPAFDVYCEVNLNNEITDRIISTLKKVADDEKSHKPNQHILLTNEIRPVLVDHPERHRSLQEQLEKAFSDVVNNRSNSAEKQRILDVAQNVEARAREAQETAQLAYREETKAEERKFNDLLRIWSIAIVLLGSGSERLNREPKRELARLIVELSSILLEKLLRGFPREQFKELKDKLKSDDVIRAVFELSEQESVSEKQRGYIELLVDAYEFSVMGYPIRVIFEQLGNLAGQAVLRASVASVESDDAMENLIARIWAAEINAAQEKSALLRALHNLPVVPFLRYSLSTYFLTRVFWNHWDVANRLALLDAAEESLRPIAAGIDKGRMQRIITSKRDEEEQE
ncbi:nucleoside phosphorylase [Sinorhizobium terangae]|uniref:Nucleoside phosphorylase domain-containing protein n=1 Tax=Sinorhizobium terangae TaxID=110322 RepID=A0A6N7LJH2_SINTE|nr:hypothetical protein [Sinorhizobium terangae]MBB4184779.1 nucleoside phosphorylase [Sinorhizobium terangae]MQX17460.1 hypothetical protein [Sinorhizobium terangae]